MSFATTETPMLRDGCYEAMTDAHPASASSWLASAAAICAARREPEQNTAPTSGPPENPQTKSGLTTTFKTVDALLSRTRWESHHTPPLRTLHERC